MKTCRQCNTELRRRKWKNGKPESIGQMNARIFCSKECRAIGSKRKKKSEVRESIKVEKIGSRVFYQCVVCEKHVTKNKLHPNRKTLTCGRNCTDFLWSRKYQDVEEMRILYRKSLREHKVWAKFVFGRVA